MATRSKLSTLVVDVEPDIAYIQPRGTATFDCDVIDYTEPIHAFAWTTIPPISDSRLTYDNNQKTIHIHNLRTSENNTIVTCTVFPENGVGINFSGEIVMLEEDNDGDGGEGDGEDGENPRPRPRLTTPRKTTQRIQPSTVPANDVLTRRITATSTITPNVPKVPMPTSVPWDPKTNGYSARTTNPATIGTLIAICLFFLLAIIFVIVRRVRKNRQSSKRQRTGNRSAMYFNPHRRPQDGYDIAPTPPMAPTIDSRNSSQSPDLIPPGHGRLYNPRYQKPIHKNHKSLPSLAHTSGVDVEEYVYMEPGDQRGQSLGMLGVPFGDGYDHLARSNPESLHKLANPISPPAPPGTPTNYAKLTAKSPPQSNDPSYENHDVARKHTFELNEQKRLKYASLNHQDGTSDSLTHGQHPPKRKTSYAKIRGVLRILRTQNSTRVNIDPH